MQQKVTIQSQDLNQPCLLKTNVPKRAQNEIMKLQQKWLIVEITFTPLLFLFWKIPLFLSQ